MDNVAACVVCSVACVSPVVCHTGRLVQQVSLVTHSSRLPEQVDPALTREGEPLRHLSDAYQTPIRHLSDTYQTPIIYSILRMRLEGE